MTPTDLVGILPLVILAVGASVVAALGLMLRKHDRACLWAGIAFAIAAALAGLIGGAADDGFGGAIRRDAASVFFSVAIAFGTAVVLLLAIDRAALSPDRVALLLLSASGALAMATARDLVVAFLGLATLAVPLYALSALLEPAHRARPPARDLAAAGITPLLFLAGAVLVYADTGSFAIGALAAVASPSGRAGIALLIAALGATAVFVPFHVWSGRTYASAPVAVIAFLTVIVKLGAFAGLLRLAGAITAVGTAATLDWGTSLAVFAGALLIIGNIAALGEASLKRLLTYTSVAQSGYVASAAAASVVASPAVALSLVIFAALMFGALGVVGLLPAQDARTTDLHGLAHRRPWLVVALGVIFLGLTGLPPTAGFIAKFAVFEAGVGAQLTWLVILGALVSVISAITYVRVLFACFERGAGEAPGFGVAGAIAAATAVLGVLAGVIPGPLLEVVRSVRF